MAHGQEKQQVLELGLGLVSFIYNLQGIRLHWFNYSPVWKVKDCSLGFCGYHSCPVASLKETLCSQPYVEVLVL